MRISAIASDYGVSSRNSINKTQKTAAQTLHNVSFKASPISVAEDGVKELHALYKKYGAGSLELSDAYKKLVDNIYTEVYSFLAPKMEQTELMNGRAIKGSDLWRYFGENENSGIYAYLNFPAGSTNPHLYNFSYTEAGKTVRCRLGDTGHETSFVTGESLGGFLSKEIITGKRDIKPLELARKEAELTAKRAPKAGSPSVTAKAFAALGIK